MKRILSVFLATLVFTMLAACGSSAKAETAGTQAVTEAQKETAQSTAAEAKAAETAAQAAAPTETAAQAAAPAETAAQVAEAPATEASAETAASAAHSDVLVAYFSRADENYKVGTIEKGNTQIVAEYIAKQVNADSFHIQTQTPYPADYDECCDVAKKACGAKGKLVGFTTLTPADVEEIFKTCLLFLKNEVTLK